MVLKQVTIENTDIFYTVTGTGNPVVLLHGFAEDSSVWDEQVKLLKEHYTLIIPDLPGTGRSSILQKENCGLEDYAEFINRILDAEKISKCSMIGHSMGGYITLAFAELYRQKLNSFMLFHSSAYADDAEKIGSREKGIAFIQEKGPAPFLKATITGLFYDTDKSRELIGKLVEKSGHFSAEALIQYYRAMIKRPDRTSVLKKFAGPIGFILGEHDKAVPFEQGLRQTHIPAVSHITILRQSAHMGMLEEHEKANENLLLFLNKTNQANPDFN